jgi:hypothetical protein
MKTKYFLPVLIGVSTLVFFSYTFTRALLSDTGVMSGNTFAAAATFPSITTTPSITATPTIEPTIVPTGIPTPKIILTSTPIPSPTGTTLQAGDVVINEINWAGNNTDGSDEWIELKNNTTNAINLTGWTIENLGTGAGGTITIATSSATISANGYYLISAHIKENSKLNVQPDVVIPSISLTNTGEQLTLRTNTSLVMDIANGTVPAAWFQGTNTPPKKSMERKSPANDGTLAGNWQSATTHTNLDAAGVNDEFGTPRTQNGL